MLAEALAFESYSFRATPVRLSFVGIGLSFKQDVMTNGFSLVTLQILGVITHKQEQIHIYVFIHMQVS